MESYSWPGEVRELRSMVEHLFGESKSEVIEPKDFAQALERKLNIVPKMNFETVGHEAYMLGIESEFIICILRDSSTQQEAAQKMGLKKSTLHYRLKALNINPDEYLRSDKKSKNKQKESDVVI